MTELEIKITDHRIKRRVITFQVDMKCAVNNCGGLMQVVTGVFHNEGSYPHKCDGCGREENYKVPYPYITYEIRLR